jgi:putative ABC transport system permease protein
MVLTLDPDWSLSAMLVRLAAGDVPRALGTLQATWDGLVAEVPFQYTFLEEDLGRQYESEARWSRIVTYAAMMAIFVACLGLFGLAALAVAARSKEVGIRKVMGASVGRIALLLSSGLVKLVAVALLLGAPVAFFAMRWWLEGFAYRIEMQPWTFVLAGLLALSVAWLAVGYQAIEAGLANPGEVLRHE